MSVTIVGIDRYPACAGFNELRDAVEALCLEAGDTRDIIFAAHMAAPNRDEIPAGAIIYNLENVPVQVDLDSFRGHEIWDFSEQNLVKWASRPRPQPPVQYCPVGYHPTMERFRQLPWEERDIDVVFSGFMSTRRVKLLEALRARGLNAVHVPFPTFGPERDKYLARAKLALNMMYDGGWVYPFPRGAHLAANRIPMLNEDAPEIPNWAGARRTYDELADRCVELVAMGENFLEEMAEETYQAFKKCPMVLPKPSASAEASPFTDPRWSMLRTKPPAQWDVAAMYDAARGEPVSDKPVVAIVVPSYRETETVAQICRLSRNETRKALFEQGISSAIWPIVGDSLVCRMRQRAVHMFLLSPATHLLFWDTDIENLTPECVGKMVASGHAVVAGACPFKDMKGRTVHNLWDDEPPVLDEHGCVEVRDAGTGFMLIRREALIALAEEHPELLHWSMSMDKDRGAPLWAIFDTGVVGGVYQSEDYMFCHLWQELGGTVHVYAPAQFAHWGEHGFRASFLEQHGLTWNEPAP